MQKVKGLDITGSKSLTLRINKGIFGLKERLIVFYVYVNLLEVTGGGQGDRISFPHIQVI